MPEILDPDSVCIRRSYAREVLRPMRQLKNAGVQEWSSVQYGSHRYPLLTVHYPDTIDPNHPFVLLSGGVHGEEPAGVYAVIDFLKEEASKYADRVNMVVFPCVNPSGFEADTRKTMNGVDLNRQFGTGSDQPEVRSIEDYLVSFNKRFALTIDCHEDGPTDSLTEEGVTASHAASGCYLYENMVDKERRIGRQLIDALPPSIEVCQDPIIYDDINDRGVIAYPEANKNPFYAKGTRFDTYLAKHWTDHSFTLETCMVWPMEKRIEVQRTWIRTALDLILRG